MSTASRQSSSTRGAEMLSSTSWRSSTVGSDRPDWPRQSSSSTECGRRGRRCRTCIRRATIEGTSPAAGHWSELSSAHGRRLRAAVSLPGARQTRTTSDREMVRWRTDRTGVARQRTLPLANRQWKRTVHDELVPLLPGRCRPTPAART